MAIAIWSSVVTSLSRHPILSPSLQPMHKKPSLISRMAARYRDLPFCWPSKEWYSSYACLNIHSSRGNIFLFLRDWLGPCQQVVLWIVSQPKWISPSLRSCYFLTNWFANIIILRTDILASFVFPLVSKIIFHAGAHWLEVFWEPDGCWEAVHMWGRKLWHRFWSY